MVKRYFRVKSNGKWKFVPADRFLNPQKICECPNCLQTRGEEE